MKSSGIRDHNRYIIVQADPIVRIPRGLTLSRGISHSGCRNGNKSQVRAHVR